MTRRERMLAALAASLLILVALRSGLGRFQAELDRRESAVDVLREQVSDAELALRRGELAAERLAKWRHRSMPENAELASSLYQAWLSARLRVAGFRDVTINERPSVAMNRSTGLRELSFEVRQAVGDIPALVKFLFAFYESPHLHKISKLTLLPQEKGQQLKLSGMTIDTLVLPGADRDDELAKGKTDRLALAGEREYLRSLADRNVFVA